MPRSSSADVDARGLELALRRTLRGDVRFDDASRALYATDASNYRRPPIGVVRPRDAEDVVATIAACRQFGAPVLSRGGGTSLAGQGCNVAVVLDTSRYFNRLLNLDPAGRTARVQPGIVLDVLRDEAEKHHLTFGPDPATHLNCCLGGMIGNNACGVHSMMAGRTSDNVLDLEILTYDGERMRVGPTDANEIERIVQAGGRRGEIYARLRALRDRYQEPIRRRFPKIPRRVSGFNLDELLEENGFNVARALVGTEGTCVAYLDATLRLVHSPPARVLAIVGYDDVFASADHLDEVLVHQPIGLEGVDDRLVEMMRRKALHLDKLPLLPEGGSWLFVEFGGGTCEEAAERAKRLIDAVTGRPGVRSARAIIDGREQHCVWAIRESGLGASAFVPGMPETWEGWEDSAVHPSKLGAYLRDLRQLMDRHGYFGPLYGHFGQGCVHTRINFDLRTREGIAKYRRFVEEGADLVVRYGGSLSGEHGDGQCRAELLPRMFGPELVEAFREFKRIWDPRNRMNPGKVVDARRLDEDLRLGEGYRPPEYETHFRYPNDRNSFAQATLRCVGVGKCRREQGATMCPTFRVTRDEMHSTRGRAHLLFEMVQGDVVRGGWRDERVKEALDLCLACKGCKGDCPANVDIATYKAEFLAQYYKGRMRPLRAYAFGLVFRWARLASAVPWLANLFTQTPGLSGIAKWLVGVAPRRRIPRLADETFRQWFDGRAKPNGGERVVLWADTFANYFQPSIARAATEVLEAAGFRVEVPGAALCCGRPLYDYGMLDLARRQLCEILSELAEPIRAGVPIVVLEPSCLAVFRDELRNLMPENEEARKLSENAFTIAQLLEMRRPGWTPGTIRASAMLHGHCHQKALSAVENERALLSRVGLEVSVLDAGCCGMAGAFGFEREHYDVSVACGELVLLPAMRSAARDALIVADGFSCREQIAQCTDRRGLHTAEVLRAALKSEGESRADASARRAAKPIAG